MLLSVEPEDERSFRLVGELDMSSADDLLRAVAEALEEPGGDLTLDMSGLAFIDSSGLRALLEISHRLAGGRLILAAPSEQVVKVFSLVRVDTFPNVEVVASDADPTVDARARGGSSSSG
jgi:anti-sigma B factor antagonist